MKTNTNVHFIHMNGRINSNTSTVIKHIFSLQYTLPEYMYFIKLYHTGFFVMEINTTTIMAENEFMKTYYNHIDS